MRVVQTDSVRVELEDARMVGDTLIGLASGSAADAGSDRSEAIALSRVTQVAAREPDLVRTVALIAGLTVLVVGIVFGLAFRQALWLWYDEIADTGD